MTPAKANDRPEETNDAQLKRIARTVSRKNLPDCALLIISNSVVLC